MGSRIRFASAKEVFEAYPELSETVHEPDEDNLAPEEYALTLHKNGAHTEALAYFAHALSKRESVRWGLRCVEGLDVGKSERDREVLALSEIWTNEGDEDTRAAVHAAAEASHEDSASVWIGFAVGWSLEPEISDKEKQATITNDLTAKAVNTALLIALGTLSYAQREKAIKSCISAGLRFAESGNMPEVRLHNSSAIA